MLYNFNKFLLKLYSTGNYIDTVFRSSLVVPHRFVYYNYCLYFRAMFIKQIKKKNKNSDKEYIYYRLIHGYKIGNKTRHQNILNLGRLEEVDKAHHKALADRIEELVTGNSSTLFPDMQTSTNIEAPAQEFSKKIITEKLFIAPALDKKNISKEISSNYHEVDLDTIEQIESRSIGAEWLIKQAMEQLDIKKILSGTGMSEEETSIAQMLLTAKAIHPSSELESERWLHESSAAKELYNTSGKVSRYKLYKAATQMYDHRTAIDNQIYNNVSNLFSNKSKIVIYDLTNMYFEGQMLGSKKADFGRSKQKKSGNKLIGLALSIDSLGFVRYSKFYKGNVSEPATFEAMLSDVVSAMDIKSEKPVIVMDAGIATEENLEIIKSEKYGYDYVCVSRTIPKQYDKLTDKATAVSDNRGHKIELTKVFVQGKDDCFLHVKSSRKKKKEESIDKKLTGRLEAQLQDIKDKLSKPRALKKTEKVHEKVGKIKAKLSKVGWLYDIKYTENKEEGIITDITWKRVKEREKPKGEYFLRYTKTAVKENDIWQIYNLTREVEAVFRCLKTDLDIRPIYHQVDEFIEPHIWLGIMAYQIVNYIRKILNDGNINYSWTTIVRKMESMQSSIVSVNNNRNEKIYIKLCTRPTANQIKIFNALDFKHRPFVRKTKVVPQL